jgi:tetratricopeptide (TPR) repeat protein
MFARKQFRGIAVFTLFIFICFTSTLDYSYSQEENPLLKAQGLYKQGNLIEAVKVLEAFVAKINGKPSEKKRLAEAYYLLARIYYDAGEDARVTGYMKQAVEAYADIGKEEGNLDFKARLERVREEWLKSQAGKKETAPEVTKETAKTEVAQPIEQEKEKPVPQLKKKKKFPWLLAILGVGVIVVLVMLLTKKKKQTLNVTVGEGVDGTPAAGSYSYQKGTVVNYNYSQQSGYINLTVKLDGNNAAASGAVTMNDNHSLTCSATKPAQNLLFFDDFEDGNTTGWEMQPGSTGLVQATTENKKNGAYSMKLYDNTTTNSPSVMLTLNTNSSRIGLEFYEWTSDFGWDGGSSYVLETTHPSLNTGWGFNFGASTWTQNKWWYCTSQDKAVWATTNPLQYLGADFPQPVAAEAGQWHKFKIEIYGPDGKARFWYDDEFKGEISITPTTAPIKYIRHGISWSSPTGTTNYKDDFKVYEI